MPFFMVHFPSYLQIKASRCPQLIQPTDSHVPASTSSLTHSTSQQIHASNLTMFRRFSLSRRSSLSNSETDVKRDINSAPMTKKPCLVISSSSPSIDPRIIQQWTDEGFDVHYARVHGGSRSSTYDVESYGDALEDGEKYAVVSYHCSHFFPWLSSLLYNNILSPSSAGYC